MTNTPENEIRKAVKAWLLRFNTKDESTFFDLFHPEIVYANGASPLMRGISEIRPWYQEMWKHLEATAIVKEEQITVTGDMALFVGRFLFQPDNSDHPAETGRVALVYRKNENGDWLLAFDMDNRPPDVQPADFDLSAETTHNFLTQ